MAQVRFRANYFFTGEKRTVGLRMEKPGEGDEEGQALAALEERQVRQFLAELEKAGRREVLVTLDTNLRKATRDQWALLMILVKRLAANQGVDYKAVYAGIRMAYFPTDKTTDGVSVITASDDLSTVDLSRIIEGAIAECADRGVDVSDIYVLWSSWRHGRRGGDPLEGDYRNEEDYIFRHPVCETCGRGLANDPGNREGQLAHIVGADEGGTDALSNRLRICTECHLMVQHTKGWDVLTEKYPHVKGKIKRAKEAKA